METPEQHFDEQFEKAVGDWRERHRLREDDAVVLLVELFRIHQRHWDELRRREFPSLVQFRDDIKNLADASRAFREQVTALTERLPRVEQGRGATSVTLTSAWLAALAGALAGYLLGRAWL